MAGKATDVYVRWAVVVHDYEPLLQTPRHCVSWHVRFFSVPTQEQCEFTAKLSRVHVVAPREKTIELGSAGESFKVGKVRCQVKRSLFGRKVVWVVGGIEIGFTNIPKTDY